LSKGTLRAESTAKFGEDILNYSRAIAIAIATAIAIAIAIATAIASPLKTLH